MNISKTPFRISFFGGHTDFPDFFNDYGGATLSVAINKYCYVTVRDLAPFFDYTTQVTYSKTEAVNNIKDIEHPLIRETLKFLGEENIRLIYDADIPSRSGLGTSSAFAVGMLNALYAKKGIIAPKKKLADEAIYIERDVLKETGGWQDQIASAYGGINKVIYENDNYKVVPLKLSSRRMIELNNNLMMFFTGMTRISSNVQKNMNFKNTKTILYLKQLKKLVFEAERILSSRDALISFGKLLDKTWKLKKDLNSRTTNGDIDEIYARAKKAGAVGGKIIGAGGGGMFLFYVENDKKEKVRKELSDLMEIPFEFSNSGSEIIKKS